MKNDTTDNKMTESEIVEFLDECRAKYKREQKIGGQSSSKEKA
jgi:hypothetical protein